MALEEPNCILIPNEYIDFYQRLVSPAATVVFLCICRYNYGWPFKWGKMTVDILKDMSALSKSTIEKAIKELLKYDVITPNLDVNEQE